jgi:hypothetical protein
MNNDAVVVSEPAWKSVVLVCKDCRKRGSGPGDLKPKAVASEVKRASRGARLKTRVVLTTCLGLCPKGAMAIGMAGAADGTRLAIVRTLSDVERTATALLGASARA